MNFSEWRLVLGDTQERAWSDNEYIFRVGREQQEADLIFRELQSNTPIQRLIDLAAEDEIIRTITFLSYYLVNPTFRHDGSELGANFFWFPLDQLNEDRYRELIGKFDQAENDAEDDVTGTDDEEDDLADAAPFSDYPMTSLVGRPVIEAAVSDSYVNQSRRKGEKKRIELLQDRVERRKEEDLEEMEDWLNNGYREDKFLDGFSEFAKVVGRMPSLFLMAIIESEDSRLRDIHEVFTRTDVDLTGYNKQGPELLLSKLNDLTETHPALENPAIEGYCLDRNNRDCDFHVTKYKGFSLENGLDECEYCGSDLFRIFRAGFDHTVKEAWMMGLLPELVVARTLEQCDWVEEVIPHRIVQMKSDEGITPSVEVDVSVHTTDDEVVFFEVTSQREDAVGRVSRKIDKFNENGVAYDGLVQISLGNHQRFVEFGDNEVAASAWMIPGLETPQFEENLRRNIENL